MEWNRKPRKRLTQIHSTQLFTKEARQFKGEGSVFSTDEVGTTRYSHEEKKKKNSDTDFAPITESTQNGS